MRGLGQLGVALLRVAGVEVLDLAGLEAVRDQVHAAVLEGAGGLGAFDQAHKGRAGVVWQLGVDIGGEGGGVELALHDQGGHAGLALVARDRHAVDDRLRHAGRLGQALLDLDGGDVLALPPEGVADAVDEVEIAFGVLAHQVAGAEPAVALLEDVRQDLLFRRGLVGVARKVVTHVLADQADGLAHRSQRRRTAQAVGAAHGLFGVQIELDQTDVDLALQQLGHPADGALLAVEVEQRNIAFRRAVEFQHAGNGESLLELGPDVGAQAVAEHQLQLVITLDLVGRAVDQITAQLADIDEHGRARTLHVGPEAGGRELLA